MPIWYYLTSPLSLLDTGGHWVVFTHVSRSPGLSPAPTWRDISHMTICDAQSDRTRVIVNCIWRSVMPLFSAPKTPFDALDGQLCLMSQWPHVGPHPVSSVSAIIWRWMSAATKTGDIPPAWNCFGVDVTIRLLRLTWSLRAADNMLLDNMSSLLVTCALGIILSQK